MGGFGFAGFADGGEGAAACGRDGSGGDQNWPDDADGAVDDAADGAGAGALAGGGTEAAA